jgi:hypothetical protein
LPGRKLQARLAERIDAKSFCLKLANFGGRITPPTLHAQWKMAAERQLMSLLNQQLHAGTDIEGMKPLGELMFGNFVQKSLGTTFEHP